MQRKALSYKIYFDGNDNLTALAKEFLGFLHPKSVGWTKKCENFGRSTEKTTGRWFVECHGANFGKRLHQSHPCGFILPAGNPMGFENTGGHIGGMVPLLWQHKTPCIMWVVGSGIPKATLLILTLVAPTPWHLDPWTCEEQIHSTGLFGLFLKHRFNQFKRSNILAIIQEKLS